ncbi:MAG: hypothetical protein LBT68_05045 [Spirochaetales bacterium]|jgi:hypothetical protein|nr:hypothetical protein [Spirochaetales bacterium]
MAAKGLLRVTKAEKELAWRESRLKYVLDRQSEISDALKEKSLESARKFKEMGIPTQQIADGLGLSLEEIDTL